MCYWYASLYTVLEGLKSSQIEYVPIEKDILDIIDDLRLFRNVIYHPQPKYLDKRFFLIMGNKNSRNKINKIHLYLDKKLIEVMKNLSQNTSSQDIIEFFKQ